MATGIFSQPTGERAGTVLRIVGSGLADQFSLSPALSFGELAKSHGDILFKIDCRLQHMAYGSMQRVQQSIEGQGLAGRTRWSHSVCFTSVLAAAPATGIVQQDQPILRVARSPGRAATLG